MIGHHSDASQVGSSIINYPSSSDSIMLTLIPRENMTWRMWSNAVNGMISFLLDGFTREWQFLILEQGFEGEVGYGTLYLKDRISDS